MSSKSAKSNIKLPKIIILVGLPGSGKSYFSSKLQERYSEQLIVVNGDTLGSQSECEKVFMSGIKSKKKCVVDKCNVTTQSREDWAKLAMVDKSKITIVWFDYSADECLNRVKNRVGHPTIKFGRGDSIIKSFAKQFEKPTESEGFKRIIHIKTFHAANAFLKKLGCDPASLEEDTHVIKFPRTHHIFDAADESQQSSVTRDDLLLSDAEIQEYCNTPLTIEEKVDGANLGITIDENYNVIFQNRSHIVTYASATQFKGLESWESDHSGDIFAILMRDNNPTRYVLYGEWCYAKHSIKYDNLPDYFLAFDIFDKYENKFYSRSEFHAALEGTDISAVPIIAEINCVTPDEMKATLLNLLETQSQFTDGLIEGVYIRKDNEDFLERRCKLVRPEFTQNIDVHWSKMELEKNKIKY
jgi:atypical dual specificity phosphatase